MFRKCDIVYHCDGYGPSRPAVNVKIHGSGLEVRAQGMRAFREDAPDADPRFTWEWIDVNVPEDAHSDYWQFACELGFEHAVQLAQEIFGPIECFLEGRSDGWFVTDYTAEDVETWDAIMVTKWGRFAKACREQADSVPCMFVDLLYYNVFVMDVPPAAQLPLPGLAA